MQRRSRTGKPVRLLKSRLTEAFEQPGAPPILPMPLQTATMMESMLRVERAQAKEWVYSPVGQIVGQMRAETTCREVIYNLLSEFVDAKERMDALVDA